MERSKILLLLSLQTLALALLLSPSFADDDVVVLTESNFEKEVGQDRGALVEFYAPWYRTISLYPISVSIEFMTGLLNALI